MSLQGGAPLLPFTQTTQILETSPWVWSQDPGNVVVYNLMFDHARGNAELYGQLIDVLGIHYGERHPFLQGMRRCQELGCKGTISLLPLGMCSREQPVGARRSEHFRQGATEVEPSVIAMEPPKSEGRVISFAAGDHSID